MKLTNLSTKLLAGYQVLGGLIGITSTINEILSNPDRLFGLLGLLYVIAIFLFSFSIYSGYKLINSEERGIYYSRINQSLQLIIFAILGYGYSFASGLKFVIGIDTTSETRIFYKYSLSTWRFMIGSDNDSSYLGINVVALILLIFIEVRYKKLI